MASTPSQSLGASFRPACAGVLFDMFMSGAWNDGGKHLFLEVPSSLARSAITSTALPEHKPWDWLRTNWPSCVSRGYPSPALSCSLHWSPLTWSPSSSSLPLTTSPGHTLAFILFPHSKLPGILSLPLSESSGTGMSQASWTRVSFHQNLAIVAVGIPGLRKPGHNQALL